MSAPNFYMRNAKRYFVLDNEQIEDMGDWQDTLTFLCDTAYDLGFDMLTNKDYVKEIEGRNNDNYRDYYGSVIPCVYEQSFDDKWKGTWIVELVPLFRNGYWEGGCLDYSIRLWTGYGDNVWNDEATNMDSLRKYEVNDYLNYLKDYEGKEIDELEIAILMEQIQRLIEDAVNKFYEFAEATGIDEYAKAWQASNGEAGYTNLSAIKRRAQQKGA